MTDQQTQSTADVAEVPGTPGDGMAMIGLILLWLGIFVCIGSLLVTTTAEAPGIEGIIPTGRVGNLPGQHMQLREALFGALMTITGTLLYGFGVVSRVTAAGRRGVKL